MIKRDEMEYSESCLNKARSDERLFVLMARDPAAPVAIRAWVHERIRIHKNTADDPQVVEALECARLMEVEHAEIEAARRQEKIHFAESEVRP